MKIVKKANELEIHFDEKVVKLRGHQDKDAFSLFTESLETNKLLSQKERESILSELHNRNDIVVR